MKKVIRLTESDLTRIVKRVIREQEESFDDLSDLSCDNDTMVMALTFMIGIISMIVDVAVEKSREMGVSVIEAAGEEGHDLMGKIQEFSNAIEGIEDGTCGKEELMEMYEELIEKIENN
jgi:hypothetical protein